MRLMASKATLMKTISSLFVLLLAIASFAQDSEKVKELGLIFTDFDQYGITYRFGNEQSVWRLNALNSVSSSRINDQFNALTSNNSLDLGASIGREKRKPLSEKLEFRYGIDIGFSFSKYKNEFENKLDGFVRTNTQLIYTPSAGLVLGFNYLTKHLIIGAEVNPNIGYTYIESTSEDSNSIGNSRNITDGIDTSFDSFNALISVVHRF